MNTKDVIFESHNFTVERHSQPFISREEGGHIRIFPKDKNISCINELTSKMAKELIWLEAITRLAILKGMKDRGVDMVWVNIEDLGNWSFKRNERPTLHIHMFGRARNATKQKWPEAPFLPDRSTGFYEGFEPLNEQDMAVIAKYITEIISEDKYKPENWF